MHISDQAKRLLIEDNISELLALDYKALLPEAVQAEIRQAYLHPSQQIFSGDSVPPVFIDPMSLLTYGEACVLSSGFVFSREDIEQHIASAHANGRPPVCPISQEALVLDIGYTGRPYVLLPKIDDYIATFKRFNAEPKLSERHFLSQGKQIEKKSEVKQVRSASPAIPYNDADEKIVSSDETGCITLKVSCNRLKLEMVFDQDNAADKSRLIAHLKTNLPLGRVSDNSYWMDSSCFGRCWKEVGNNAAHLCFWFPRPKEIDGEQVTYFGDYHVARLIKRLSKQLGLSVINSQVETIPEYTVNDINIRSYIIALPEVVTSTDQMINCCDQLLDYTNTVADNLDVTMRDIPMQSQKFAEGSITSGPGLFGAGLDVSSTGPSSMAHTTS